MEGNVEIGTESTCARSKPADASRSGPVDARTRWFGVVRMLAILVPLGFLAGRVDPHDLPDALATVGVRGFIAASLFQIGACVVSAMRWSLLLRLFGAEPARIPSLFELTRIYFVGLYFQMIPSGLVGEIVRARRTASLFETPMTSYVVIFVDRASASFGLITLGLVSTFAYDLGLGEGSVLGSIRGGLAIAWFVCLFFVAMPFGLGSSAIREKLARAPRIGPILTHAAGEPDLRGIVVSLALSVAVEVLTSFAIAATVVPTVTDGPAIGPLLVAPVILLLTFMPITPGALGQRELAFVTLLGSMSVSGADATAGAIVTLAVTVLLAIVGFVALVSERHSGGAAPPGRGLAPLP